MNPARRLFPICVSPLSFAHLRFGIVNPYGTSCVSTSRSPRRFSHRQFGLCNPHRESACLLSEALGRSHIGILDLTTLTHLVRVGFRHSRTIRSSPCRAPLLTLVAEPPPGGSIWTSLLSLICLSPCPSPPSPGLPPASPRLGIDTLSRKYHFSIQTLLNNDHLGAWLASGPYLPSPAFPPAPQNLGIDTLSRKYYFSVQSLLTNDHLGAWLASGPYLPSPASPPPPQILGIDTLSRQHHVLLHPNFS